MKNLNKIAVGVAIIVIASIITTYYSNIGKDYAKIKYQLSANESLFKGDILEVGLKLRNEGNMDIVPTSTVSVINATIQKVEIKGIQQIQLSEYCDLTDTVATISNLTIEAGMKYDDFATIYVTPNEGVSSFTVESSVKVWSNFFNPNKVVSILPHELAYNSTSDGYQLFD